MAENSSTGGATGRATETSSNGSGSLGIQFNRISRDDEMTTERIKPQIDAATKQRRAAIIAIVVVAFVAMIYISWERSGRENPFAPPAHGGSFAPGAHDADAAAAGDNK